jgi:outer membrane protein assembly factor BamB
MSRLHLALLCLFSLTLPAAAANWPSWRGGLDGSGQTPDHDLPTAWSRTDNVRWKTPLPEAGNSTPIVWGNRVFLTQAIGKGANSRRALLCLDRADGKVVWQKDVVYKENEPTHATNPYCSASPVTDGERVVASFGSAGLFCWDTEGKELWRKDVGKMEHIWGNASSPILYDNLAILWCGPGERQVLLAVDKKTGETVWEHQEPGGKSGLAGAKDWIGSWSTPIVVPVEGRDQLILSVPEKLKGFDPRTGKELWSCDGLGKLVYTSAVVSDGVIVTMSGFHGPAMAVRTGGKGDCTATHRLWRHPPGNPQRIGSAVVLGEHIYILNDPGTFQCLELKTGKQVFSERLSSTSWGSLVATGDRLYVTNQAGQTFVLAASPEFKKIATNALEERTMSSIAVSDGELFIRTYKHLWCIGKKK